MANEEIVDIDTTNNEAEGNENESDFVKVPKSEWEKTNQTLGSLKRENKDLKKPKEPEETAKTNQPDVLLEKLERMALRQAGITHQEDIDLAKKTAKKWGMDIDEVLSDEDFKLKLERQQTGRANVEATSGVKGSGTGSSQAKNTAEYWLKKGTPPTATDIPDSKVRRKINVEFFKSSKKDKVKFYNS